MSKYLWDVVNSTPVVLMSFFLIGGNGMAAQTQPLESDPEQGLDITTEELTREEMSNKLAQKISNQESLLNSIDLNNSEFEQDPMSQVTSVSQLRDVSPTDWAYEALRSLVERYGCLVGYPDRTYRGNRALSRYEFAAGLNACMQQMERLIAQSEAVLREDMEKLQRLMKEFETELGALGARVDNLEGRVAFLEDHQFSTTTKLSGEVIFAAVGQDSASDHKFDGSGQDIDSQFTLSNRVRLVFKTSFTGKDSLITRLESGNVPRLDRAFGTDMARLGFDFDNNNDVELTRLYYTTPIGDKMTAWVGSVGLDMDVIFNVVNPFLESSGTGALSRFSRRNPFSYRGPEGAGLGLKYQFTDNFELTAIYLTDDPNDPTKGQGLFNGAFSTGAQLDFFPTDSLNLAVTYLHTYYPQGEVNVTSSTGSNFRRNISDINGFGGARDPFNGAATTSDNIGIQGNWRITEGINWSAWLGYANATGQSADYTGVSRKGDNAELWTWNTNFSFIDLGKKGAVLSFSGGQLPRAASVEGGAEDRDTSYIVEALYKYPVTKNIILTPGGYVIFNPNSNSNNDTIYVGVLRTTFKF